VANENARLNSAKSKVEMACRELRKNSDQINETNKQILEEGQKNREEIAKTFEKNIESVKLTEEESKDYEKENEKFFYLFKNILIFKFLILKKG